MLRKCHLSSDLGDQEVEAKENSRRRRIPGGEVSTYGGPGVRAREDTGREAERVGDEARKGGNALIPQDPVRAVRD